MIPRQPGKHLLSRAQLDKIISCVTGVILL